MDNKPYHHGNLRSTLIEAGLELISMEGEETLSLRKAALKFTAYGKAKAAFPHPANSVAHSSIRRGVIHTAHNAGCGGIPLFPSYLFIKSEKFLADKTVFM